MRIIAFSALTLAALLICIASAVFGQEDDSHVYGQIVTDKCRWIRIFRHQRHPVRLADFVFSGIEFMATTDLEETQLIHGRNLDDLLRKRIALMEAHRDDEPFIDPRYIEREAGRA